MILVYTDGLMTLEQVVFLKQSVIGSSRKIILTGNLQQNEFLEYFVPLEQLLESDMNISSLIVTNEATLPDSLLVYLFSNKAINVSWLNNQGMFTSNRSKNNESTLLFIFPGPILPLTLGSHQRAFNVLSNLKAAGVAIDLLLPDNKNLDKSKLISSLGLVANNVYFYKDKRPKFKKMTLLKRKIEQGFRLKVLNKDRTLPDLFSERLHKKNTESLKRWVNRLYIAKGYSSIIVSYAWMLNALQYIWDEKDQYKLICDTHDVQFYRNLNLLNRKERLFFDAESEKKIEIDLLNKCDHVLAISKSDEMILKSVLDHQSVNIISSYASFDYAIRPIKQRPQGRPIHFGFIGGKMSANVMALEYVLDNWWPKIKQHSPDSILYIAGSICRAESIRAKSFFDPNIKLLGFVDKVDDFYNSIEVALNPVLVAGGLNFKSIEAVMFGKHLFTNALGTECLGNPQIATVIDENTVFSEILNQIEFDLAKNKQDRLQKQTLAKSMFNNQKIISGVSHIIFN